MFSIIYKYYIQHKFIPKHMNNIVRKNKNKNKKNKKRNNKKRKRKNKMIK